MTVSIPRHFSLSIEVLRALTLSQPVVALESAVITHGLPRPQNLTLAKDMEEAVRNEGGVPATIAMWKGMVKVGLGPAELEQLADEKDLLKISRRDVTVAIQKRASGGTTVSGSIFAAQRAGIQVFATGGIGGVHPQPGMDISADLPTLAETPIIVVCAGAKAILDLSATLEYLETFSVPVIGYQSDEFPAFYSRSSGFKVSVRLDSVQEIIEFSKTQRELGLNSAILVAQAPPEASALKREFVDSSIRQAQDEANKKDIHGQALTPFLLQRLNELTHGASMKANIDLLLNNARLAARIAAALHSQNRSRVI